MTATPVTPRIIAYQRLYNQRIVASSFKKAGDVVKWLGAVQAQDYLGALWGIGLRMKKATEAEVERSIADKTIVRSWPMRGTLHFVAPDDLRWMLKLLAPRVIARCAGLYRQAGLDKTTFSKSSKLFTRALKDGKQLTRIEMYSVLERAGISTAGQRGLHILGHLAQQGLLCFGTREGKQQRFTLLDEWIPPTRILTRTEALAELAQRYFNSHGPATLQDFAWWSGLTVADAKTGLDLVKSLLEHDVVDGNTYWMQRNTRPRIQGSSNSYLLPAFDEFTVAYKDKSILLDPEHIRQAGNGIFNPVIVTDGKVAGTWKRTLKKNTVEITFTPFASRTKNFPAAESYGRFIGLPVEISS